MRWIPAGSVDLNSRQACEKVAFPANSMRLSFFPLKTTQEWSMSIYTALLFQQGYIQNTELALSLAADDVGERNDATPPPDAAGGGRDAACGRHPGPFRHGALASAPSAELSPFTHGSDSGRARWCAYGSISVMGGPYKKKKQTTIK